MNNIFRSSVPVSSHALRQQQSHERWVSTNNESLPASLFRQVRHGQNHNITSLLQLYLGYDHVIEGLPNFMTETLKIGENRVVFSSTGKENTSFAPKWIGFLGEENQKNHPQIWQMLLLTWVIQKRTRCPPVGCTAYLIFFCSNSLVGVFVTET